MEVFLFTLAASLAALAGGLTALKSRHWLNRALALTAGLVLGLVMFDLLPEIFDIVHADNFDSAYPMIAMAAGFLSFHLFERFMPLHESSEEAYSPHRHPRLGTARAIALTGHSFMDGLSIGVAFQVSSSVGLAVALAVVGHRFADGFDTTTFMIFHKNKLSHIKNWLNVVVIMPVVGGLLSLLFDLSEKVLAVYLGFFAGLVLYIAASNLLPMAHSKDNPRSSFVLTMLGVVFLFVVTRFA
ncbi:MAG TPA: ZIP family metal transporter [Candidatus Saccharimonadales bacterium]|nr:ZIP family metal transporter [Candidatus Saccharimonadales bacterium]